MTTNDAKFWIASYRIAGKFGEKFSEFGESSVMNLFAKLSCYTIIHKEIYVWGWMCR